MSSPPLPEHITREILASSDRIFIKEDPDAPQFVSADPDCRLGPTVTSTDFWEHMYRMERRKRKEAEKKCGMPTSDDESGTEDVEVAVQLEHDGERVEKTPIQEQRDRERRDSIKNERSMSAADDFAEWNTCMSDSPFLANKADLPENVEPGLVTPLKMIEIDGSDDEGTADADKWWKADGFKKELRSRTHAEIAELALQLVSRLDAQGVDVTPALSQFLRRQPDQAPTLG